MIVHGVRAWVGLVATRVVGHASPACKLRQRVVVAAVLLMLLMFLSRRRHDVWGEMSTSLGCGVMTTNSGWRDTAVNHVVVAAVPPHPLRGTTTVARKMLIGWRRVTHALRRGVRSVGVSVSVVGAPSTRVAGSRGGRHHTFQALFVFFIVATRHVLRWDVVGRRSQQQGGQKKKKKKKVSGRLERKETHVVKRPGRFRRVVMGALGHREERRARELSR